MLIGHPLWNYFKSGFWLSSYTPHSSHQRVYFLLIIEFLCTYSLLYYYAKVYIVKLGYVHTVYLENFPNKNHIVLHLWPSSMVCFAPSFLAILLNCLAYTTTTYNTYTFPLYSFFLVLLYFYYIVVVQYNFLRSLNVSMIYARIFLLLRLISQWYCRKKCAELSGNWAGHESSWETSKQKF